MMISKRRVLMLAFMLAALATVFLGARLVVSTLYWSQHRDAPVEAWMTVGMVARSYDVPRAVVAEAAGVPDGARDRRPLSEIAGDQGLSPADLVVRVEASIAAFRAEKPRDGAENAP